MKTDETHPREKGFVLGGHSQNILEDPRMTTVMCFLHHKTNIVYINGNLTAARYQHEVLDTEVIPLLRNHRGMKLLHDGAPAHRTSATTAYKNANNVNVVDSHPPPKSRDLNIIE